MSLSLSKVTSAWAYSLAELQPVPQGQLTELLQVCSSDVEAGKDAGGILQKIMPLTVFLEKAHDKNVQQVVPAVVQLLQQLPSAWLTAQTGPQQVQADFTQVMVDLRRAVRSSAVPATAKQQLSNAVLALMQQLFKAVAQQRSCQDPGWQRSGCYLLLRTLTRTAEFLQDPGLPMLPADAARMLEWLKQNTLQLKAADRGVRAAASNSNGTAAVQAGALPAQDDKPLLLLTKLVLATTAAPAAVAAAAAEADGAGLYSAITSRGTAARANGATSPIEAAYAAADANGVGFANGAESSVASAAASACVLDPVLLCQLLEWSSTRVKLALQWLLDRQAQLQLPSTVCNRLLAACDAVLTAAGNTADAPSREATTAAAALAATCIYTLQSGGCLAPDLEQQLSQQVSSLLEVALTVGEAAVASASEHQDVHKGSEADKVLALGARILASMTPFVAAAAQRVGADDLFMLTGRLQQIMLSAAGLAARQCSQMAGAVDDAVLDMTKSMSFQNDEALAGGISSQVHQRTQHEAAGSAQVSGPLSARLRRLALRKEVAQQRKLQKQLRQQEKRQRRGLREASAGRKGLRRAAGADTQAGVSWAADGMRDDISAGQQLDSRWDGGPQQLRLPGNTLYPRLTDEDKAHPWSWDVTQSLTVISGGITLADLPLSTGVGGFLLARAACEMLCEAMAAGCLAGHAAPVRKLMLLPAGGDPARTVTALAMGRLYAKLNADEALGQLLLPLLADLLSSSNTGAAGLQSDRGSTAGHAEVGGAVLCAIEGMASVCVQHGRDQWLYEQALQLLLSLYRRPTALSLQLLAGPKAPASTAGLLADTLHLLAAGLEDAQQHTRKELSLKLLLLFSDVAAGISSGTGLVRADLGRLLVAVAVAAEGLDRGVRLLRGNASSSNSISHMSSHDIQSAQREASTTRLFRSLWLYTAIHQLVQPSAGMRPSSGSRQLDSVQWDWQVAAGRLAAVTPLLVVGTTSYFEVDMVEKLKIELGEQLSQAGSLGSTSSLSTILAKLLGGKPTLNGQALPQPHKAVLLGFVVAVAASELSRAALAPLPDVDEDPVVACPIAISLGYLKGVLPDGVAAAWVAAIVRRAAELYIERLLALAAKQEREEEDEDAVVTSSTAPALVYAEQLACVLIANLGDGDLKNSAENSLIPTVATLTDSLLKLLLSAFPALYYSHACYAALLAQLQEEEGDTTMGQVQAAQAGVGWVRTRAWVSAAAARAPMTTEAILHSFITSSDSLPGATAPAWLRDDALAGPRLGAVQDNRKAQKAAYRRAADLLRACVEARMQAGGAAAAADSAYEGALGLTRKLHYTGYVQGVINGRNSGTSVLQEQLQRQEQQQERERRQQQPAQLLLEQQADREAEQLAPPVPLGTVPVADGTDDDSSSSSSLNGNTEALLQNLQDVDASTGNFQNGTSSAARTGSTSAAVAAATAAAGAAAAVTPLATSVLDGCSRDSTLGSLDISGPPGLAAVVEEIAGQLDRALLQPGLHDAKLAQAQLGAAALLAVQPDAFTYSSSGLHILRALAHAPLRRLTPETMRLSQFCWCWVNVESPEILVPLLSAITNAWIRTIDRRLGLFSGTTPAAAASASTAANQHADNRGDVVDMLAEDHGADDGTSHDDALLQAMWAHFLWLSFLQEQWAVISKLRDGRTAAARVMYGRMLAASLQDAAVLSHHPAALGAYFRLLTLALQYGRSCLPGDGSAAGTDVLLLFDKILQTALLWFRSPPRYFARCTRRAAAEQVAALEVFKQEVQTTMALSRGMADRARTRAAAGTPLPDANWPTYVAAAASAGAGDTMVAAAGTQLHPVWGRGRHSVGNYTRLLLYLCDEELMRLRVWTDPLKHADASRATPVVRWREYVPVAWQVDPALALSLLDHFPAVAEVKGALEHLVVEHAASAEVQMLPKAALLLANAPDSDKRTRMMRYLPVWAPGTAAEGLELLSGPTGGQAAVRSYAIKCLFNAHPEKLVFFLPQLVQLLRGDADGAITNFFLTAAAGSDLFAHQLIWALNSEARPPEEAFNPEVKRSGWQPPKDTGLWDYSTRVGKAIQDQMTPVQQEYWQGENGYFSQVTALSGYLYKFSKDERRVKLQEALAQFKPPRSDLYLPTNPEARVCNHIPSSGACMQSAAKVPILVAFDVEVPAVANSPPSDGSAEFAVVAATAPAKMACIFKVGDDIRQDVLAIQVIKLLHDAFTAAGLSLYLRPYGCLPTGYECGIIEVVPNTKSRAALGEVSDRGLHDIFCSEFGPVGSPEMERARENFIVSEAAYAVASYLLQAKDRHNGNIMLDDQGHIVHIDFGFILEISPGGNLGFESAAFKLSHEMTQLLDPGGRRTSPQFKLFTELVIRAYLAARTVAEPIIATVSLMADSGLPCFSRGAPVANLRNRFHLEMNDAQAAAFMRSQIDDAYDKWTTGFYDYIQSLQNKIPY